jgi:serine/threonine-protein kinase RsbW
MMGVDSIYLKVPAKPEYILVARLTCSAVASRADFGVDEIEDIKVAVAEAGTVVMNQGKGVEWLELNFEVNKGEDIHIHIFASGAADGVVSFSKSEQEEQQVELSFDIMESLMDGVEKVVENGFLRGIKMYKKFGG